MSKLVWRKFDDGSYEAETTDGARYSVYRNRGVGALNSYGAFFRSPRGRARLAKVKQPLGCVAALAEAKALCEGHWQLRINVIEPGSGWRTRRPG